MCPGRQPNLTPKRQAASSIRPMDENDIERFEQHLFEPESSFEVLLRGHLWIENFIGRILELQIVNQGVLDLDRMSFRQKIDIAQAFGFIGQEDGQALKALNRLRNKLAHNLMAEPGEEEIRHLVSTLTGAKKAAFDAVMNHPDTAQHADKFAALRYWFISYVMDLDYLYARMKYAKDNHLKLAQVAGACIGSKAAGKEISEEEARSQFNLEPSPVLDKVWISVMDRYSGKRRSTGVIESSPREGA
jgi:hypothetical protein